MLLSTELYNAAAAAAHLVVKQHDACSIGATTFDFCHAATATTMATATTTTVMAAAAAADN